jgi:peptide chain release factor 3
MEIERQRGICVYLCLAFNYKEKKINILDTPGHKDFAEDTFRTVDGVIVVIDVAKGVEEQTEKLVAVCRLHKILLSSLLIKWTVKATLNGRSRTKNGTNGYS